MLFRSRPTEPRSLASLSRVVRSGSAPSRLWTTLLPTTASDDEIVSGLGSFLDGYGARLESFDTHAECCAGVGPDADETTGSRHVSVVLDREVAGPVLLGRIWMVPMGAAGLAVNGIRRSSG